jgi:hypothetical protein
MRRWCLFLLVTMLPRGLCLDAQTLGAKRVAVNEAQRQNFDQAKFAIVVGIGAYPEASGLSRLNYAQKDASDLAAELTKQHYTVRLLTDSDASRSSLRRSLNSLKETVDPNNATLLFFFSGHGFEQDGENYLATFGASIDDLKEDGLSVREVERLLGETRAKRRLVFIDACRSDLPAGARGGGRSFRDFGDAEGLRVLYSTAPGRYSFEDDTFKNGVFTHFLLNGIRGEAAGADRAVTFRDLADYVTGAMRAYSFSQGRQQVPREWGKEIAGDFLVARISSNPPNSPANAPQAPSSFAPIERTAPAPPRLDGSWRLLEYNQNGFPAGQMAVEIRANGFQLITDSGVRMLGQVAFENQILKLDLTGMADQLGRPFPVPPGQEAEYAALLNAMNSTINFRFSPQPDGSFLSGMLPGGAHFMLVRAR